MAAVGAILGNPAGMKPVSHAIDANLRAKGPSTACESPWNFPSNGGSSPLHVLVVDDEPLIRWSVSETLLDLGYVVKEAPDAGTALRTVTTTERPFDVVVLDLRLPDMNDLSLLGTLRQLLPRAALILMTAFGTAEIISEARALGAAVLNKPFELDELKRLLSPPGMESR